jgi:hypothetical protein
MSGLEARDGGNLAATGVGAAGSGVGLPSSPSSDSLSVSIGSGWCLGWYCLVLLGCETGGASSSSLAAADVSRGF